MTHEIISQIETSPIYDVISKLLIVKIQPLQDREGVCVDISFKDVPQYNTRLDAVNNVCTKASVDILDTESANDILTAVLVNLLMSASPIQECQKTILDILANQETPFVREEFDNLLTNASNLLKELNPTTNLKLYFV